MRKIIALFIVLALTFCNVCVFADKIVAVVDKSPITASEVQNLHKLLVYFGNGEEFKGKSEKAISKLILEAAIADKVIENYANSSKISVSEAEIDGMIKSLAEEKKLDLPALNKHIAHKLGVPIKEFRHKIEVEILRSKIVRGIVGRNIEVSEKEVENLVLSTNFRDASLDIQIFTSKDNSDKSYMKMQKLRNSIRNCNQAKRLNYRKFATLSEMSSKLSMLSPTIQNIAKEIPIGTASDVIEDGSLRIIMVCSRKIDDITIQDSNNLTNFLGSKKLQIEAQKFLQDLRKKAYIKIID